MTITYDYNHPDYDKLSKTGRLSKPLTFLSPEFDNEDPDIDDSYDVICAEVKKWDAEKTSKCLTKLIYKHLSNWSSKESDQYMYGLWCVLAMIEDFKKVDLLPSVLEILKQDDEFHHKFFIDEKFETMPAAVIYNTIKEDSLPMLLEFMKTPGLTSYAKRQVALACGHFPTKQKKALPGIQKWLSDVLSFYYSSDGQDNLFDGELLETLVYCALRTRSAELKQLIIKLYSRFRIPSDLVKGGCNEVRKSISSCDMGTLYESEDSASYMLRSRIVASWDDYDDDDSWDATDTEWNEENDEDFNPEDYSRQEFNPFTFNSAVRYKKCSYTRKYTLKISLKGSKPPIWRKIEVPSNITLSSLAGIIILSMGWVEDHLHEFITPSRLCYATSINEPDDSIMESLDGRRYCVSDLIMMKGDSVIFEYDYGDSWNHTVKLVETAEYADGEEKKVRLLSGKRACPPDDCGGIWGYMSLCEAMEHPESNEARKYMEWLGAKFDPEYFPLEEAQFIIDRCNRNKKG